jgi:hypothetical protein
MSILINLYAGPGAGKSTIAAGTFHALKLRGVNAELVQEYAKDIVWTDTQALLDFPIHVFAEQHQRIARLWGKVDIIVTDSPLPLAVYYALLRHPGLYSDHFAQLVAFEHARFTPALNFWILRDKPYEPKGRLQTEEEALAIDGHLRGWLAGVGPTRTREGGWLEELIDIKGNEQAATEIASQAIAFRRRQPRALA